MLYDQALAQSILAAISTAQEAVLEMHKELLSSNLKNAEQIGIEIDELINSLRSIGYEQGKIDKTIRLGGAAESALASLDRIRLLIQTDQDRAMHKIEFELLPMLQGMFGCFFFWGCVFPDKNKMEFYYQNERHLLFSNEYIENSAKSRNYKYDMSITVTAYNKLDYTKMCLDSLLQNIPDGLNWELILINHGSTDGTKEYFEALNPTKQLDIKINGCDMVYVAQRIIEGEYHLGVCNDVIITPNAIENMLRIMREDERTGFVVPTTPNVANLQTISANFSSLDELIDFARKNNIYDPFRHEIRTRLCNPVALTRTSAILIPEGIPFCGNWFSANDNMTVSFPDDLTSMLFRRAGYKNVLAKDAYCHHFGSVTIRDDMNKKKLDSTAYIRGRRDFYSVFGIDPWGTGFCYDPQLVEMFDCPFDGHIEILGVNCGMGSNSLKIKEMYKELRHNLDVSLTNVTNNKSFIEDLRGISDAAVVINSLADISPEQIYHHIVLEDPFEGDNHEFDIVSLLIARLVTGGSLYVKNLRKDNLKNDISNQFPDAVFSGIWVKIVRAE